MTQQRRQPLHRQPLNGVVVGLFTAGRQGAAMTSHEQVEAVAGRGILGDRYATGLGHWSDPRWPDQELTLIASETAVALGIEVGLLRRNVALAAVELEALIGVTFRLGEAVLHGVRRCDPCRYLDGLTRPGMAQALGTRGGLRAGIIRSGRITCGDRLTLLAGALPQAESERRG